MDKNWSKIGVLRKLLVREVVPSIHSAVQNDWYYGASESTADLILFQKTIFEISTLSPIPNLEFKL